MGFPQFVNAVARRAELPPERASSIARAVLQTLAERVSGGEVDDLAEQLPDELSAYLAGPAAPPGPGGGGPAGGNRGRGPAQSFGPVEFLRRVGERAGVEPATAQVGVRAVFATLKEAVTVEEFQDILAQLPKGFRRSVDPTPPRPYDE